VPPTPTFGIANMIWLNGHVSPEGRVLGVAVKNDDEALSTWNATWFCDQTIP
jgi:hypothetical protein